MFIKLISSNRRQNVFHGHAVVDELMGKIDYPQLRFFRTSFDDEERRPRSFLLAEIVVSTLRRTVLPCFQETTFGFSNEQTPREELGKTDEGAQFGEVELLETSEPTHKGLHQRHHVDLLCCRVPDIIMIPICTVISINCMIEDSLQISLRRGI